MKSFEINKKIVVRVLGLSVWVNWLKNYKFKTKTIIVGLIIWFYLEMNQLSKIIWTNSVDLVWIFKFIRSIRSNECPYSHVVMNFLIQVFCTKTTISMRGAFQARTWMPSPSSLLMLMLSFLVLVFSCWIYSKLPMLL